LIHPLGKVDINDHWMPVGFSITAEAQFGRIDNLPDPAIGKALINWWMIRTRSLADCILAHAVTNGCLAVYVISLSRWQYWLCLAKHRQSKKGERGIGLAITHGPPAMANGCLSSRSAAYRGIPLALRICATWK
jgi:hypothetical protein